MNFRLLRDPVFLAQLVAAVVMAVSTFVFPLTDDQQGTLNGVAVALAAIISSWKVSDGQLALLVGGFKAVLALAVAFGLHWSPEQQLVFMVLVQTAGAAFVRTQVGSKLPPPPSTATPTVPVTQEAVLREQRS